MRIPDEVLIEKIWDYMTIESLVLPADVIIVAGSTDMATSAKASELFSLNFAPLIVFSGAQQPDMDGTEADLQAHAAEQRGVPKDAIIREPRAKNLGETIRFSEALLKEKSIEVRKVILVCRPYVSRQFLATAEVQWDLGGTEPKPEFMVTHEDVTINNYYLRIERGEVIRKMLGDFSRIKSYAKKGYQTVQTIPADVQEAFDELVERRHQIR